MDPLAYNLIIDKEIRVIVDKSVPYLTPSEVAVIDDIRFLESLYTRVRKIASIIVRHKRTFKTDIHNSRLQNAIAFLEAVDKKVGISGGFYGVVSIP